MERWCNSLFQVHTVYEGKTLSIVVDTGFTLNLLFSKLGSDTVERTKVAPIVIMMASRAIQHLTEKVTLVLEFRGGPYLFDVYLIDALPADGLLEMDGMDDAGWVVLVPEKAIYHMTDALPSIKCALCSHHATLACAEKATKLTARAWTRVRVRVARNCSPEEGTGSSRGANDHAVMLTPTLPPGPPLHGAPTIHAVGAEQMCVLLCNTEEQGG